MTKPVVAVDIDEVLTPFLEAFIKFHNREYGSQHAVDDFKTYTFGDTLKVPEPEAVERVLQFYKSHDFTANRPFLDAAAALKQLQEHYELIIITSRHPISQEQTLAWLEQHFPQTFGAVHFSTHLYLDQPLVTKTDICKQEGVEILIDDNIEFAKEAAAKNIRVLLFGDRYSWNQAAQLPAGIERVGDWHQVLQKLLPHEARKAV